MTELSSSHCARLQPAKIDELSNVRRSGKSAYQPGAYALHRSTRVSREAHAELPADSARNPPSDCGFAVVPYDPRTPGDIYFHGNPEVDSETARVHLALLGRWAAPGRCSSDRIEFTADGEVLGSILLANAWMTTTIGEFWVTESAKGARTLVIAENLRTEPVTFLIGNMSARQFDGRWTGRFEEPSAARRTMATRWARCD